MYKIDILDLTHADEIFQIESQSFSDPWTKESIISSLENPLMKVFGCYNESDTLCGFVCVSVLPPEAEILDIAVSPDRRKEGVGKALINSTLFSLKTELSVETVFLEVRESNVPARSLYKKFGFEEIGKRSRYYSNPTEDAILMKIDLDTYSI